MSEKTALMGGSGKVMSVEGSAVEYQVCCFKAPCLAKVPVVRGAFRVKTEEEKVCDKCAVLVHCSSNSQWHYVNFNKHRAN